MHKSKYIYWSSIVVFALSIFIANVYSDDVIGLGAFLIFLFGVCALIIGVRFLPSIESIQALSGVGIFVLFISLNVSAGSYLHNHTMQYYTSFPRFFVLGYLLVFAFVYYLIGRLGSMYFNKNHIKWIFLTLDLISLGVYFVALLYTSFVSPH